MSMRRSEASSFSFIPGRMGGLVLALGAVLVLAGDAAAQRTKARPRPGAGAGAGQPLSAAPDLWKLKPDPPAEPVPAIDDDVLLRVPPSFFGGDVVFPSTPSPFVAVGRNGDQNDVREIWDLADKKRVGVLRGEIKVDKPFALSADGTLFAGKAGFDKSFGVWDTKTGRMIAQIRVQSAFPDYVDFAGPDQLVTGVSGDRLFEVWDLKTQKSDVEISPRERVSKESVTLSPGRKYLAMVGGTNLTVYDVAGGKKVGALDVPKIGGFDLNCKTLAFSNDGTELAGVFDSFGTHVLSWDVNTGRLTAQYKFDDKSGVKALPFYEGRALDWLSDKSGWLLYGAVVVDKGTGQKLFTIPSDTPNADKLPRRIVGDNLVMITAGEAQKRVVRGYKLPTDKIAQAAKLVKEGGSAADAALPGLKPADRAGAKRIKPSARVPAWSVAADGGAPSAALPRRSIALRVQSNEVQGAVFSSLDGHTIGVTSIAGGVNLFDPNQNEGKSRRFDRFDLLTGRALGRLELPGLSDPIALSPDGERVLAVDSKEHGRLDVYDADQKHVAGWRPYDKESDDDKAVGWAEFLTADQVLTVNKAGTLILWSLPDCKAVYVADAACEGPPLLSPGRKYLATYLGGTFRFLDPATGELKGEAELPPSASTGRPELKGAAFSVDGSALAALVSGTQVVRWETKTGKVTTDFRAPMTITPVPNTHNSPLEYCGTSHVLLDGRVLIDLDRKAHIWSYFGPTISGGGPDGRHWYVAGAFNQPAALTPINLPEAGVNRVVALVNDPKAKPSLRVGGRVALTLECGGPPNDPNGFRNAVTAALTAKLRANGMTPGDGGNARVVVHIDEKNTGKTIGYRDFGDSPFNPPRNTLVITELECEVLFEDAQGRITLVPKRSFQMPSPHFLHLPQGETVETYLKKTQWNAVRDYLGGVGLPYFVARQSDGVAMLPGVSDLNAAR